MAELTKKTMDGNEAAAYTSYAFTENERRSCLWQN